MDVALSLFCFRRSRVSRLEHQTPVYNNGSARVKGELLLEDLVPLLILLPVVVAALITFLVSPLNTSVLQDGSVVLRCMVASDGTLARISWLKDGNVIPADRYMYATALTPVVVVFCCAS